MSAPLDHVKLRAKLGDTLRRLRLGELGRERHLERNLRRAAPAAVALACLLSVSAFSTLHRVSSVQQVVLPDTTAITPEMVNAGRVIFHGRGTCSACHGSKLEGGPIAPTLKPHAWKAAKDGAFPAIYGVITHGVSGTAMVAHPGGISDTDAAHVAAYIWSVDHRGAKP